MLYVTISVLILALAALFAYYNFREAQQKKIAQALREKLITRIERIKTNFKASLQQLVTLRVLPYQGLEVAYRIVNYYFVFQPITVENVEQCERLLKSLLKAIDDKMIATSNSPTFVQEQLNHFLRALPKQATGYNASFYRNDLPVLIQNLVDAQDNSHQESVSIPAEENFKEEVIA